MTITFTPKVVNHGFDRTASPPWQMVPRGGTRELKLAGVGAMVLHNTNSTVLQATITGSGANRVLKLKGLVEGKADIWWLSSAGIAGPPMPGFSLQVNVKKLRKVKTAFHYVHDGRVQNTTRTIAQLTRMITSANTILTPQANVSIEKKSAAVLNIAQNLRRVVRFSSHLPGVAADQHEWDDIVAHKDAAADFNVFFVKEYEQDTTPLTDNANAGTIASQKCCIMEDGTSNAPQTLAHETVHLLGVSGHSTGNTNIMSAAGRANTIITRAQANSINPSGT